MEKAFDEENSEFKEICRWGNVSEFFYYSKEVLEKNILIYFCHNM